MNAPLPRIPPKHLKDGCYSRADALEVHLKVATAEVERLRKALQAIATNTLTSSTNFDRRYTAGVKAGLAIAADMARKTLATGENG
jgi:hypothetical protein